jgi:hypothetical protein
MREFCLENGIKYQSSWTLAASPAMLKSTPIKKAAKKRRMKAK